MTKKCIIRRALSPSQAPGSVHDSRTRRRRASRMIGRRTMAFSTRACQQPAHQFRCWAAGRQCLLSQQGDCPTDRRGSRVTIPDWQLHRYFVNSIQGPAKTGFCLRGMPCSICTACPSNSKVRMFSCVVHSSFQLDARRVHAALLRSNDGLVVFGHWVLKSLTLHTSFALNLNKGLLAVVLYQTNPSNGLGADCHRVRHDRPEVIEEWAYLTRLGE